jgi:hypothetical protein
MTGDGQPVIRRWNVGIWLVPIVLIGALAGLVEVLFDPAPRVPARDEIVPQEET